MAIKITEDRLKDGRIRGLSKIAEKIKEDPEWAKRRSQKSAAKRRAKQLEEKCNQLSSMRERRQCNWIVNQFSAKQLRMRGFWKDPDALFCSNSSMLGLPYCKEHMIIAYKPIDKKGKITKKVGSGNGKDRRCKKVIK